VLTANLYRLRLLEQFGHPIARVEHAHLIDQVH